MGSGENFAISRFRDFMISNHPIIRSSDREITRFSKLALRRCLLWPQPAGGNFGHKVVLAFYRRAGQATHDRDLSYMRQSVSDRSLKEFLQGSVQWLTGTQIFVESRQAIMEAHYILIPPLRFRIAPFCFAFCDRQRPVQQVADMTKNFAG